MLHLILPQAFRRMLPPLGNNAIAVSYTHLDVYKRQGTSAGRLGHGRGAGPGFAMAFTRANGGREREHQCPSPAASAVSR